MDNRSSLKADEDLFTRIGLSNGLFKTKKEARAYFKEHLALAMTRHHAS